MFVGPGGKCSRELRPTKSSDKIDLQVLNIDKLSNHKRTLNVIAFLLRFIKNLKKSLNREEEVVERYVTTEEYSKAEYLWVVFMQHDVTSCTS